LPALSAGVTLPANREKRHLKIVDIRAFPVSFPLPPGGPRTGVGQARIPR
jgi:hypothetical protein